MDHKNPLRKKIKATVSILEKIGSEVYLLGFSSDYLAKGSLPGQFLGLKIDNALTILRRPFSIHRIKKDKVFILFRIRGKGTRVLAEYKRGDCLDIIGPLGKGFVCPEDTAQPQILLAGGMGVAPLVFLAQKLKEKGFKRLFALLGAENKEDIFCREDFKNLGFRVYLSTEDGSVGFKGKVTDLLGEVLKNNHLKEASLYACGPVEMFLRIKEVLGKYPRIDCQVSFEQFMGCGLGVCGACVIETKQGYKKLCQDGPVFALDLL